MASTDRDVLLVLYRSTGGDTWKQKEKWNTGADLSEWHGVVVNDQGRVVELDLAYNNLQGILKAYYVGITCCSLAMSWAFRHKLSTEK